MPCPLMSDISIFRIARKEIDAVHIPGPELIGEQEAARVAYVLGVSLPRIAKSLTGRPGCDYPTLNRLEKAQNWKGLRDRIKAKGVTAVCRGHARCELTFDYPEEPAAVEKAPEAPCSAEMREIQEILANDLQPPAGEAVSVEAEEAAETDASTAPPESGADRGLGLRLLTLAAPMVLALSAEVKACVPGQVAEAPLTKSGKPRKSKKPPLPQSFLLVKKLNSLTKVVKDGIRLLARAGASDEELRLRRGDFGARILDLAETLMDIQIAEQPNAQPAAAAPAPAAPAEPARETSATPVISLDANIKNLATLNRIVGAAMRLRDMAETATKKCGVRSAECGMSNLSPAAGR